MFHVELVKGAQLSKTIAVCNQKGGVGKTTTAINLSAYLAASGYKVLVLDIDPQANATSGMGIAKTSIKQSLYNVFVDQAALNDVILQTTIPNLFLAPADLHLTGAQIELVSTIGREQRLKKSINIIRDTYSFIIIDCPPSLGLLTINALTASDTTLIPLQCEYYAMEGLSQLLHTIKLVQESLNPSLDIEGVVLTMADYRTNLTNEVINEAREFFKDKIYDTIIPRSIRLSEAPGYGKPVMLYDKSSHGAEAYKRLAHEFISRNSLETIELKQIKTMDTADETDEIDKKDTGGKDGEAESVRQGPTGVNT